MDNFQLSSFVVDRKTLLLGGASTLFLAACSGGALTPQTQNLSADNLYSQMRKAGVLAYAAPDGTRVVLPEFARRLSPQNGDGCPLVRTASAGSVKSQDDCTGGGGGGGSDLPIIATVSCYAGVSVAYGAVAGNFYDFQGGYNSGLLGPPYLGTLYTSQPPGLQNGYLRCIGETFTAIGTAMVAIASNIKNAQNAIALYGPNVVRAATWLLTGTITAAEFASLFITFCGPGELIALIGAAGVTIGAVIEYIKCLNS